MYKDVLFRIIYNCKTIVKTLIFINEITVNVNCFIQTKIYHTERKTSGLGLNESHKYNATIIVIVVVCIYIILYANLSVIYLYP